MAHEQGLLPVVKGAVPGGGDIGAKVVSEYIARPCLLGPASDLLPAAFFSKQESLCVGYLSGSLDQKTALTQLQSVFRQSVDQVISQAGLRI